MEEEGDCQGKFDSLISAGKRREGIFAGKRREEKRQGIIDKQDNLRESNGQLPADSCDIKGIYGSIAQNLFHINFQ